MLCVVCDQAGLFPKLIWKLIEIRKSQKVENKKKEWYVFQNDYYGERTIERTEDIQNTRQRRGVGLTKFLKMVLDPSPPPLHGLMRLRSPSLQGFSSP